VRGLLDALQVIMLSSVAVIAGGRIYVARVVLPALQAFSPEVSVQLHQQLLTRRSGKVFKPANYIALVASGACIIVIPFVDRISVAPTIVLTAIVLAALSAYGVLTTREMPINREVNSWAPGEVRDSYPRLRATWDHHSQIKLACSVLAFACAVAALIVGL
jgi:hypothetical protein